MNQQQKGNYYSGTSGLVLPVPNKSAFPPAFQDKSRLSYYASLFNSLEVNSSFYKVPMGKTIARWAGEVPDDFQFTFKLWKDITHCKGFSPVLESIDSFYEVINQVGDKKGCLLIQLPPSVTIYQQQQVKKIVDRVIQHGNWRTAIEFRHPSWYTSEIFSFADDYGINVVLHDMPASYNMHLSSKATVVYLRFHGPKGDYRGGYSMDFLAEYSELIKEWQGEGKDVYVYFNNTIGDAITNLATLNQLVKS